MVYCCFQNVNLTLSSFPPLFAHLVLICFTCFLLFPSFCVYKHLSFPSSSSVRCMCASCVPLITCPLWASVFCLLCFFTVVPWLFLSLHLFMDLEFCICHFRLWLFGLWDYLLIEWIFLKKSLLCLHLHPKIAQPNSFWLWSWHNSQTIHPIIWSAVTFALINYSLSAHTGICTALTIRIMLVHVLNKLQDALFFGI